MSYSLNSSTLYIFRIRVGTYSTYDSATQGYALERKPSIMISFLALNSAYESRNELQLLLSRRRLESYRYTD